MFADQLAASTEHLTEMANAIQPIISDFDRILAIPHLEKYHASLNTVPVVGIKDNNIMYVETILTAEGQLQDRWSLFSSLPEDANIAPGKSVFLFPYKGDLCLSVGQAVWRRNHRTDQTDRAKAIDNWPDMYEDNWNKIGDTVLPAADLLGIVPFAVISASRERVDFRLIILKSDSSLAVLTTDGLVENCSFDPLTIRSSGTTTVSPQWSRIAYWNNKIVGYDQSDYVYDLKVDFVDNTFEVSNKTKDSTITELTASDVGLVIARNGTLYRRIISVSASANRDATFEWKSWIKQDGVMNLGVASPGAILDLNLLTRTLRSRYIDVQTSVYPVVNGIKAFCVAHRAYLDGLQAAANTYRNLTSTEEQRSLAIREAQSFVLHAKVWAEIINSKVVGVKDSVNIMTKSLDDLHNQLVAQLEMLNDKLEKIKNTLAAEKETLSHLEVAFWCSVATTFVAGCLMVAGIAADTALGFKMGEVNHAIVKTESERDNVCTAIDNMTAIIGKYSDLGEKYKTLNEFWGEMYNNAVSIGILDEATAMQLGMDILRDDSSITGAIRTTDEMTNACTTYLNVLNRQGITSS
ncbi:hypothetical protein BGW42_001146 [Actinomortierella wolfii]|nr:hypothetical protein BGW42_001146 [Actinomortierella wolfii]